MTSELHAAAPGRSSVRNIPGATYRLQFDAAFGFREAARLVPYLHELGISHCYASPIFEAAPDSTHGYDVCRFDQIDPRLGGEEAFNDFIKRLRDHKMGVILDVVPNHMSADPANPWWRSVLEWGPESPFANWFEVDWQPLHSNLRNKILLPLLEDPWEQVLESGKLQLRFSDGEFIIDYGAWEFPVAARSYGRILDGVASYLRKRGLENTLRMHKVMEGFQPLPGEGSQFKTFSGLKSELRALFESSIPFHDAVAQVIRNFNGLPGQTTTFDNLLALLREQHYELDEWRSGIDRINYRRFFDVSDLVCLKIEIPEVFDAAHSLVLWWVTEGTVAGLRIDHPDGLREPKRYFDRLQESISRTCATGDRPYLVAEKILARDETLPADWAVHGTTGYDFLNEVNNLFVLRESEAAFDRIYNEFTERRKNFGAIAYAARKRVLAKSFKSELDALAFLLEQIARRGSHLQSSSVSQFRAVLTELVACFPVYRTYVTERSTTPSESDRSSIQRAVTAATLYVSEADQEAFAFVCDLLLLRFPPDFDDGTREQCRRFVLGFQQLTSPVAAKGIEDTAFYRYHRLVSLNEVGGDPDRFGGTITEFHEANRRRLKHWPRTMVATSTHDTKRGEDVRITIDVLSEMPNQWEAAVHRWSKLNEVHKQLVSGKPAPSRNDEYLFYQTLVGTWPPELNDKSAENLQKRIKLYMLKAIKEAKLQTSWTEPNADYEAATTVFVERVLSNDNEPFLSEFARFHEPIAFFGRLNSLSQLLLKIGSPGIPDFYQGTELWDLNLVDPDNRRPVDFAFRQELLAEVAGRKPGWSIKSDWNSGAVKLALMRTALRFRNLRRKLFDSGEYWSLVVEGRNAKHVCAFARETESEIAIVVALRLGWTLMRGVPELPTGPGVWEDTRVILPMTWPELTFNNVVTGENVSCAKGAGKSSGLIMAEVFTSAPMALLFAEKNSAEQAKHKHTF